MKSIGKIALLCSLALTTAVLIIWYFRPDIYPRSDIRIVCLSSDANAPQTLALWDEDGRIVRVNGTEVLLETGDTVEVLQPLQEDTKQLGTAPPVQIIKVVTTSEDENSSTTVEGWAQTNYLYSATTCPSASGS